MFIQKLSRPESAIVLIMLAALAITSTASVGLAQETKSYQATSGKIAKATSESLTTAEVESAKTDGDIAESTSAKSTKPGPEETKLVRSIYELTKTTKSATELTAFITQCDSALAGGLASANLIYVTSLKGWALNLRGVKRMEVAKQLKSIGNSQHATSMKQAMDDFDQAITCDPQRYRSWMSRGIARVESEDFRKAALDFTNVVKLKTELATGWFNRGEALYHLGKFDAALNDYDVAISLDSNDAQALTGRGHCRFAMGKFNAALTDYEAVANLVPENSMVYINMGDACQQMGKWKDALAYFDKSLAMKQTSVGYQRAAWLKATSPVMEIKNGEEAVQLAKRAIKLTGNSAINLDTLAAAEAAVGNFEVAKTTQAKVIGLVGLEEEVDENAEASPYKARLALYEKGEAFIEPAVEEMKPDGETESPNQSKETDR